MPVASAGNPNHRSARPNLRGGKHTRYANQKEERIKENFREKIFIEKKLLEKIIWPQIR